MAQQLAAAAGEVQPVALASGSSATGRSQEADPVRKALEQGIARMEESLVASRRIAWLNLAAADVAFMAAVCAGC